MIAATAKNTSKDAVDGISQPDAVNCVQETAEPNASDEASAFPAKPKILPDENPDEQYRFAFRQSATE